VWYCIFDLCCVIWIFSFSALTLLVGWQDPHLACKKFTLALPKHSLADLQGTLPNLDGSSGKISWLNKNKTKYVVAAAVVVAVVIAVAAFCCGMWIFECLWMFWRCNVLHLTLVDAVTVMLQMLSDRIWHICSSVHCTVTHLTCGDVVGVLWIVQVWSLPENDSSAWQVGREV